MYCLPSFIQALIVDYAIDVTTPRKGWENFENTIHRKRNHLQASTPARVERSQRKGNTYQQSHKSLDYAIVQSINLNRFEI